MIDFVKFPKIARLSNVQLLITEKIDGTNAQVVIPEDPAQPLQVGSRNRWITPGKTTDNAGFAAWVADNEAGIRLLGPGTHYGEWWGQGIGRNYGLTERRWSLFNVFRLLPEGLPNNIRQVPVLYHNKLDSLFYSGDELLSVITRLQYNASVAEPGFMKPEGVVVNLGGHLFKYLFDKTRPSPEENTVEQARQSS